VYVSMFECVNVCLARVWTTRVRFLVLVNISRATASRQAVHSIIWVQEVLYQWVKRSKLWWLITRRIVRR
jgi:hypothetical protein